MSVDIKRTEKIVIRVANFTGTIEDGKSKINREIPKFRVYESMVKLSIVELQTLRELTDCLLSEIERIINENVERPNKLKESETYAEEH